MVGCVTKHYNTERNVKIIIHQYYQYNPYFYILIFITESAFM